MSKQEASYGLNKLIGHKEWLYKTKKNTYSDLIKSITEQEKLRVSKNSK